MAQLPLDCERSYFEIGNFMSFFSVIYVKNEAFLSVCLHFIVRPIHVLMYFAAIHQFGYFCQPTDGVVEVIWSQFASILQKTPGNTQMKMHSVKDFYNLLQVS